jgi:hypothetical protein
LSIRFSGTGYTDAGFNNINIPADGTSQTQINAIGLQVEVLLNSTLTNSMNLIGARTMGESVLYISNPWSKPANALVANVRMIPILTSMADPLMKTALQLTPLVMGKVSIPANFSLSFNL